MISQSAVSGFLFPGDITSGLGAAEFGELGDVRVAGEGLVGGVRGVWVSGGWGRDVVDRGGRGEGFGVALAGALGHVFGRVCWLVRFCV